MNNLGGDKFKGFSAGSQPSGTVNQEALELLNRLGYDTVGVRSKSWDEFAAKGAPELNYIFTVCDDAAEEVCPVWPGKPITAHWGVADPSRAAGSDKERRRAFETTHQILHQRISEFMALPLETLDELSLQTRLSKLAISPTN